MTTVRLLLNSGFTGANAFFALGEDRGLFHQADLAVHFTPGHGAYTAAGRLHTEGFDAAYGDLNALIEQAALQPQADLPIAVLMVHQRSPATIAVPRHGPVRTAANLAGRHLTGHASDVALRTFGAWAQAAGLDAASVRIEADAAPMAELLQAMLAGASDGVFGYVTTHTAALAGLGVDASAVLHFLPYRETCPSLYGSALMVSPRLLQADPQAVRRLVAVVRAGIAQAAAEPHAAMDAVLKRNITASREIEYARWLGTLQGDMAYTGATGTLAAAGRGDVDDARLASSMAWLARGLGWAQVPDAGRIFTRRFLTVQG